jgi:Pyridoxamine 5'-phosphate oxidase
VAGEEQARARTGQIVQHRQAVELTEEECWALLGSVPLGRVVFTMKAMPAIRPVNHLVDGTTVIIRSHLGAAIVGRAAGDGAVVIQFYVINFPAYYEISDRLALRQAEMLDKTKVLHSHSPPARAG